MKTLSTLRGHPIHIHMVTVPTLTGHLLHTYMETVPTLTGHTPHTPRDTVSTLTGPTLALTWTMPPPKQEIPDTFAWNRPHSSVQDTSIHTHFDNPILTGHPHNHSILTGHPLHTNMDTLPTLLYSKMDTVPIRTGHPLYSNMELYTH
jgi:hypothetical protein